MNKRLIFAFLLILSIFCFLFSVNANAAEPQIQRVTVYCQNSGHTASMTVPKAGRTVAGRREDIGKTCVLYRVEDGNTIGQIIGIYKIEDTGGPPRLKNGAIDVFCDTETDCLKWVKENGDFCFVQILEEVDG